MTEPGYYDTSYPPSLLAGGARRRASTARQPQAVAEPVQPATAAPDMGAPAPGAAPDTASGAPAPEPVRAPPAPVQAAPAETAAPSPRGSIVAGVPAVYNPPVRATERPRNLAELSEQYPMAGRPAWTPGQYVSIGTSGKRAYWDGTGWRMGEAPGAEDATRFPPVNGTPNGDLTR